jgi:hypothetical protein
MWIVWKQVGLFTHYLTLSGMFQPGLDKARLYSSKEMAEIMIHKYGGKLRYLEGIQEAALT